MANSPYTLFTQQAAGPSLTAGTAASALVTSTPVAGQNRGVIPANWMGNGTMMTITAAGTITTAATPGTGLWDIRFGSTQIWTPGAVTLTASMSTWGWYFQYDLEVRTIGASTSATLFGGGFLMFAATFALPATTSTTFTIPPAAGATGFDTTVPNTLDIFFTESLTTATQVLQMARCVIWNPNY